MKHLNESWENYSSIMQKLDDVIDQINSLDLSKISVAQIQDMQGYSNLFSEAVEGLMLRFNEKNPSLTKHSRENSYWRSQKK